MAVANVIEQDTPLMQNAKEAEKQRRTLALWEREKLEAVQKEADGVWRELEGEEFQVSYRTVQLGEGKIQ